MFRHLDEWEPTQVFLKGTVFVTRAGRAGRKAHGPADGRSTSHVLIALFDELSSSQLQSFD